jgi:ATP-dependent RNA helicase DeaD
MDGSEWFRISVGRRGNADPKWLIPMICRLGHITKKDIGAIRIFDYDTKFEISAEAATKFGAAVQTTVREDVSITPTTAPAPREAGPRREYAPRPPRDHGPRGDNDGPREYKPRAPREDRVREDGPRPPRANAPGSRDHTPRPSNFGADGFSNAKPYGRGEEPKGDYKPRRAPRDNDAPRPYSPQDSEGAPKRAFKPRHEAGADAPREYKPRAPRADGDGPKKPFKKSFSDNAAGPKPYSKPYAGKRDGDGPAKPFKGPKPFKAKSFDAKPAGKPAGKPFKKK